MPVVDYPYTLTNGTVADASQVQANFDAVKDAVTDDVVTTLPGSPTVGQRVLLSLAGETYECFWTGTKWQVTPLWTHIPVDAQFTASVGTTNGAPVDAWTWTCPKAGVYDCGLSAFMGYSTAGGELLYAAKSSSRSLATLDMVNATGAGVYTSMAANGRATLDQGEVFTERVDYAGASGVAAIKRRVFRVTPVSFAS